MAVKSLDLLAILFLSYVVFMSGLSALTYFT